MEILEVVFVVDAFVDVGCGVIGFAVEGQKVFQGQFARLLRGAEWV
jgi:hypothetical protein